MPPEPEAADAARRRLGTLGLFLLAANVTYPAFPPFDVAWLAWFHFVPLFFLLDRVGRTLRAQLVATTLFATWGYAVAYFWIADTLMAFAKLPAAAAYALLVVFALLGATSFIPLVVLRRWWLHERDGTRRSYRVGSVFVITGLWLAMEGWWPRLFPWFAGLTQHSVPLTRQLAELGGITAISLPILLTNLVLYERLRNWRGAGRSSHVEHLVAAGIVVAALLWSWATLEAERELRAHEGDGVRRIALVQGNVDNESKTENQRAAENVAERYRRLTLEVARAEPDLIVWPETAFPWFVRLSPLAEGEADTWTAKEKRAFVQWTAQAQWLQKLSREAGAPIVVGGLEAEGKPHEHGGDRNFNSAILYTPDGKMASYRKNVLIPFGETVPWPLSAMFPWIEDRMPRRFKFSAGEDIPVLEVGGKTYAASICYEAILPDFCRRLVAGGRADYLLNLTNDSWFGNTAEPAQHLALASIRAVELRIPLLRVTNSGITTLVDPLGDYHDPTDLFVEATRVYDVVSHERTGKTLFARLGRLPLDVFSTLCVLAVLASRFRRPR